MSRKIFPNAAGWINSAKIFEKPIYQYTKESNAIPYLILLYLQYTYLQSIKYAPGTLLLTRADIQNNKVFPFSQNIYTFVQGDRQYSIPRLPIHDYSLICRVCGSCYSHLPIVPATLPDLLFSASMHDVVWIKKLERKIIWRLLQ